MKQTNAKALLEAIERNNADMLERMARLEAKIAQMQPVPVPQVALPPGITELLAKVASDAPAPEPAPEPAREPLDFTKIDAVLSDLTRTNEQIDTVVSAMEKTNQHLQAQVAEAIKQTESAAPSTDAKPQAEAPKSEQYKKFAKRGALVVSALAGVYAVIRVARHVVGA